MKDTIKNTIDKIYFKKEKEFFINNCIKKIELPEEFNLLLSNNEINVITGREEAFPSKKYYIEFEPFVKGEFRIKYQTIIQISKIIPIFYIQHEFDVDNKDENSMGSSLSGFDGQPYTKHQYDFQERLLKILNEAGFTELSYSEINEVVCGLNFPEGVNIFGSQVTVEQALFNDVFGYCSED